eukprot:4935380-Pyramimonas_sp.AAC.1
MPPPPCVRHIQVFREQLQTSGEKEEAEEEEELARSPPHVCCFEFAGDSIPPARVFPLAVVA